MRSAPYLYADYARWRTHCDTYLRYLSYVAVRFELPNTDADVEWSGRLDALTRQLLQWRSIAGRVLDRLERTDSRHPYQQRFVGQLGQIHPIVQQQADCLFLLVDWHLLTLCAEDDESDTITNWGVK